MTKKVRVTILLVVGVLGILTGAKEGARAQQARNQVGNVGLDVTIRPDETLPGPEQLEWVDKKTEEARRISFRIQTMLDQARKEKDTLKITCLNDKLTQIHVNLKGIEERTQALRVAVQGGDRTTSNQQFAILKIYFTRIEGLRAEAENCLGEVDIVLGETETVVTIDDSITPEDPSDNILIPDINIDPTPTLSGHY